MGELIDKVRELESRPGGACGCAKQMEEACEKIDSLSTMLAELQKELLTPDC